jgi:phospholipid/cholesterol/gamma-HCH transport system permease protein
VPPVGRIRSAFEDLGNLVLFFFETLAWVVRPPVRVELLLQQMAAIGVGSSFIVAVTGLFAGMVLALQGNYAMRQFGAEGYVGGFVAISLVRELGPVFTALMVTGRSGSAITTELGTMRVTEQIDAMESMAVNPIHYLAVPRVVAATLMMPVLDVLFTGVGYLGGYLIAVHVSGIPPGPFLDHTRSMLDVGDLGHGLLKAVIFGTVVSTIATYRGFTASGGARGVGEATTRAVVWSSVAILVLDYVITFLAIG